jgi:hypothetical protein
MGQYFAKRPFCFVKAIWMHAGFWEYSIPIQSLPGTTVESLIHIFQERIYNHYVVTYNTQKILTVYIPEESILLDIFHSLKIPFDIHVLIKPSIDR